MRQGEELVFPPPPSSPGLAPGQVHQLPQPPALHPCSVGPGEAFPGSQTLHARDLFIAELCFLLCFFSHNPPPTPSLRKTRRQKPGGAWPERGQLNPGEKELKPAPSHFPTLYNSPGNKQEGLLPFTLGKFKDFLWSGGTVPETPGATVGLGVGAGQEGNPGWARAPLASPLLTGRRPFVLCLQNLQLHGQESLRTLEDT